MRPSLCSCQCIAVERGPSTCMRYMPTLRCPVRGSRVITAGSVMNGAASPGQQVCTGSAPRSTSSPRSTTSWQAPLRTVFGRESAIDFSFWRPRIFSPSPCGGCISSTSASFVADVVEPLDAEGEAHAALGAELVDEQRPLAALRPLEEQRGPAGLDRAVDDLGDLEVRIDLGGDADELALPLEERDPRAQIAGRAPSAASLVRGAGRRLRAGAAVAGPLASARRSRSPRRRRGR